MTAQINLTEKNPLWYKDAIIYQLHVRSFYDSNGDGIGDFKGLIQKLDYVQSLGVNTLWLLPFYPSPLRDGGYDIADFNNIHPSYGSLADFKRFVKEAHKRGLRIITELVINHTSSEHKWFQRARKAKPGSHYRDFYVWSDTTEKYKDARIIFQDFEVSNWTYDHEAKAYYWHRFYSHQPDLNFENPRVQKEIFKILDFWFEMGVDGFRLDAIPYLFEREGTNCENLPETHEYLKALRKYVDDNYEDKLLLAEANQWPNDSRAYFGDGDECHMAFHFPLMPRLYMALRMEDRFPVVDIMEQTPQIPDNCQWAIFLRNHDELTLEMVSDEERDYMYKTFAKDPRKRVNVGIRRRLFPLFGGDTRTIELLNFLLFSMPGTPIIYYGDEIGMGDNYYLGDRDGVRTPMQWSPDKNAGFSNADPQKLFLPVIIDDNYHYTTVNVENNERNPSSFLWWKRRVIAKRKQYKAFGRGTIRFINTNNPKILAFVREFEDETLLVIVNLSRYSQHVELDLHDYAGSIPMEVFSRNDFPMITDEPWSFSMQFKNYFWFELQKTEKELEEKPADSEILLLTNSQWISLARDKSLQVKIKEIIYDFILRSKWFKGNLRKLKDVNIIDIFPLNSRRIHSYVFLIQLDLIEQDKDIFLMPVSLALNNRMNEIKGKFPDAVIAQINFDGEEGVLYDGAQDHTLLEDLFSSIQKRSKLKGIKGVIEGSSGSRLRKLKKEDMPLKPHVVAYKSTNSSISFGDKYFFRMYRKLQEGENPDVEILKNLTRHSMFKNIPAYVGRLDYKSPDFEPTSLALLNDLIPNVESALKMTRTTIESFFDKALTEKEDICSSAKSLNMEDMIGPFYLEMIDVLGKRTAQMHQALASLKEVKGFEPEPFSLLYQKSLYQSLRTYVKRTFSYIKPYLDNIEPELKDEILAIMEDQPLYFSYFQHILESEKIQTWKTRIHGNYKLDKLLFTGKDFMVTDFEGEVEFPLSVRKLKHCPLKDVASMVSSFHYTINKAYFYRKEFVPVNDNYLRPLIARWYHEVSSLFLKSYLDEASLYSFIPENRAHTLNLLNLFIFEKAIRELRIFLNEEPESLNIPVKAFELIKNQMK
ncbi:MAG: maltose alpha-D-glucosyltransferase [Bacteroidetes bacterium]|nr:MAG: maltose alpha-D-glucosyltransferase [Bacteroidota bacterium]